jgi:hypothetical protein
VIEFILPDGLNRLLAKGIWPSAASGPSMDQQGLHRIVSSDRVKRFAADETEIRLQPPPFRTMAMERARGGGAADFWEEFGAFDQIDPELALFIGDFGFGSESVIILDYARDPLNPPVLRLRWGTKIESMGWVRRLLLLVFRICWEKTSNTTEWVQGASDFDEFAEMLGLAEGVE